MQKEVLANIFVSLKHLKCFDSFRQKMIDLPYVKHVFIGLSGMSVVFLW